MTRVAPGAAPSVPVWPPVESPHEAARCRVHNDTLDFLDEAPIALWCANRDNEDIRDQGHRAFSRSRQRPLAADPVLSATVRRPAFPPTAMRSAAEKLMPVTRVWGEDAITAHRDFHRAVYTASHNATMIKLLDDLWDKSDRYRRLGLELPSGDEPRTIDLNQHHQILELVASGDGTGAAELARTHIANSLTASVTGALEERENLQAVTLERTA